MNDERPPQAGLSELLWLFLSPRGRISRRVYWLGLGAVFCLTFVFGRLWEQSLIIEMNDQGAIESMRMSEGSATILLIMLPLEWSALVLIAKRCRDYGWSGLVALIWMIPLANLLLVFYMGILPGNPGANQYGAERNRPPS